MEFPFSCMAWIKMQIKSTRISDAYVRLQYSAINSNLVYDSGTGYLKGYKTGADTWRPFKAYYDLGVGTNFDVTAYQGYQNFTADNFSVSEINSVSSKGVQSQVGTQNITVTASHIKSYDKAKGLLTAYVRVHLIMMATLAAQMPKQIYQYMLI